MPKRKANWRPGTRVQATCTASRKCGKEGHYCSQHRPYFGHPEIFGIYIITVTFSNKYGDNFEATTRVEGLYPAHWFVKAIRKNGGLVHAVVREVKVASDHVDVSRQFGVKE